MYVTRFVGLGEPLYECPLLRGTGRWRFPVGEAIWLDPYPDVLLEGLADAAPGPEARYEATEAISDRKSTRLNSSHLARSRMPSSA